MGYALLRQSRGGKAVLRECVLSIRRQDEHRELVGGGRCIGDHGEPVVGADRELVRQRDDDPDSTLAVDRAQGAKFGGDIALVDRLGRA